MGLIHNSHQFLHRLPALASPSRGRDGVSGCKHKEGGGEKGTSTPPPPNQRSADFHHFPEFKAFAAGGDAFPLAKDPMGLLEGFQTAPQKSPERRCSPSSAGGRRWWGTRGDDRRARVPGRARRPGDRDVTRRTPGLRSIKQTRFDSQRFRNILFIKD